MADVIENFMTIAPKDNTYMDYNVEAIPLSVTLSNGVQYTPDVKITVNDLNDGNKRFINNSGNGDKFKVTVIIAADREIIATLESNDETEEETAVSNVLLLDALDYWIENMTVFNVVTRAIDVKDGEYVVSANGSRKQTLEHYTYWELEFTQYSGENTVEVQVDTTYGDKAIKKYNAKKASAAKKAKTAAKAKKSNSTNNKFSKCKLSVLVFSKTKKKVDCVLQMQKLLKKLGYYKSTLDGWYYNETVKAVKQFQKAYNKKQVKSKTVTVSNGGSMKTNKKNLIVKLPENGKVNKDTFNTLCKAG